MRRAVRLFLVGFFAWHVAAARADSPPSPNLYGMLGLNTVPSSRMDKPGTLRAGVSASDPYVHTTLGLQLTDRFYFGLRQTSEISDLRNDPDKVFPGLDLKLKLFDEKLFRPEIAIGLQSAFGHRRMAGEYLAFSKRYENFDFIAGFGWGRFGTRNETPNPLDWTGSYFNKGRKLDGDKPVSPKDWFTGDTGFFAGVEYATPLKGLSLKADWSSDAYKAEQTLGMNAPSAYSFGLNYQPANWVDIGVALMDKNTLMARLNLKSSIASWPFSSAAQNDYIGSHASKDEIKSTARKYRLDAGSKRFYLNSFETTPYQLSQAWRAVSNRNKNSDILRLEPVYFGLKAPGISITQHGLLDTEDGKGSAEEIWQHTAFDKNISRTSHTIEKYIPAFTLRENFSLSGDDAPFLHRTDMIATLSHQFATRFLNETSLRYNLFSNLDHIDSLRYPAEDPVRSDEEYYLVKKFAVERAFVQGFKSFSTDLHISAGAGYLDEMFAGYHGEILYRPWGRNWAAGLEAANVIKRDYLTALNLGYLGEDLITGHANFYYELPDTNMTLHASIGRYLGQDKGGSLELLNRFKNGGTVTAFFTATDSRDADPYGSTNNYSSGLRFTLPLGSLKYIPDGSGIEINAQPVARDAGQKLNLAHPLFDMTEPLSYRHLTQNWADITP